MNPQLALRGRLRENSGRFFMGRIMRTKQIILRVDAEELAYIDGMAKARKMRRATFIRTSVVDGIPPSIPEINIQTLYELQKIGGNLNQLAHTLNASGHTDLEDVQRQIFRLRFTLMEIQS